MNIGNRNDFQVQDGFNGVITEELRCKLVEKIDALGVPKHCIAHFFGITVSTLQKWEKGVTSRCSISAREKFLPFLAGEFDDYILGKEWMPANVSYTGALPDKMLLCMERISQIYDICSRTPEMRNEFVSRMDKAAVKAMHDLMLADGNDSEDSPKEKR